MQQNHSPLPYQIRADLFAHLAVMEKSGLPMHKAYALLQVPRSAQERLLKLRKLLAYGTDPAIAGLESGLFTVLESHLLRAALVAGNVAPVYKRLADTYKIKAIQFAQMKARFVLPVATLIAALCIQPLPALFAGSLSGGMYLWEIVWPLMTLGLLGFSAIHLSNKFLSGSILPGRAIIERILLKLPVFGKMHVRHNARDYFESLAMLIEAGVPMFDALPIAQATINNSMLRKEFMAILPTMRSGLTLAEAMRRLTVVDMNHLIEFVKTGEASGTIPEMLFHHVAAETESLNLWQQQLVEWLPRIFYAMVAGWMVTQMFGGGTSTVSAGLG